MLNGKPDILVIWGDDIATRNVGAYTHVSIRGAISPAAA